MKRFYILIFSLIIGISAFSQNQRWDDQFISANAPNGNVYAIAKINSDIYVAGNFTTAGGVTVNNIAKWNGSSWSALGTGTDGPVYALENWNNKLYIGGIFSSVDGTSASNVACWDGTSWSALGTGTNDTVFSILSKGDFEVYVGGAFDNAGGISVNNIARWDGTNWYALGTGINGNIYSLALSDTIIIAGGKFSDAGGVSVNNLACWFSVGWHDIGNGANDTIYSIYSLSDSILIGGSFTTTGFSVSSTKIASWDGSNWHALGNIPSGTVYDLLYSDNKLYITGNITTVESLTVNNSAYKDSTGWHTMGDGLNDIGRAVCDLSRNVFYGGDFTMAGNKPSVYFGRWVALPKILHQPDSINACINDSVTLYVTMANSSIPNTFQWAVNGVNIAGATDDTLLINPADITDEGNYTCLISNSFGDVVSDTAYIEIIENVSFTLNPADTATCEGNNVLLTTSVTGEFYNLQWYHDGSGIAGTNNTSFILTNTDSTDTGDYYCIANNVCGSDTTAHATVTIYTLPIVTFSGLEDYYCNSSDQDTLHPSPTGGIFSGNGITDSIFDPHSLTGMVIIQYEYTDNNGCIVIYSDTAQIYNPPTISILGLQSSYCYNDTADTLIANPAGGYYTGTGITDSIFDPSMSDFGYITLIYNITDTNNCVYTKPLHSTIYGPVSATFSGIDSMYCGTNPPVSFEVSPPGGILSGIVSDTIFYPDSAGVGLHDIYYTFIDSNLCVSIDTFTVNIYNSLSINLGNDTSICKGETIYGLPGYDNYLWSTGDTTININILQTGAYTLSVTDQNGCPGSDMIMVTVLTTPDVNLGNDISITTDQTIVLGVGGNYDSYLWNTGSTSSFISIDGNALGIGSYIYWVQATETSGCSDADTVIVDVTHGLYADLMNQDLPAIYPNPVKDKLFIEWNTPEGYKVCLSDIKGTTIYTYMNKSSNNLMINTSELPNGIYVMEISNNSTLIRKKIVISQ